MSSPVWKRRRARQRLEVNIRQVRRATAQLEHHGHKLAPPLWRYVKGLALALEDFEQERVTGRRR